MIREQKYKLQTRQGRLGFTVIELMLAIAILGVIIYALFSVFNQTQRALRRSETNTDVAQKARAVAEMIVGELEQAQPTMSFHLLDLGSRRIAINEINMLGGMEREFAPNNYVMNAANPILQRTNFIHKIFFYNNRTNGWQGIGYRVVDFNNGVGSLQRFETNIFGHRPISNELSRAFVFTPLTNRVGLPEEIGRPHRAYRHIADGIVHLTFVPFDRNGRRLGWDTESYQDGSYTNDYVAARARFTSNTNIFPNLMNPGTDLPSGETNGYNALLQEGVPTGVSDPRRPGVPNIQYTTTFQFLTNVMPAYIEMEFGMLEPDTLAQYYTMLDDQNPNAAKFLQRQISKVHLFRQRITIRTASQ
ncbi:MAG TPA: prepilin-type N-terminal cleavage/methylation domain-containing protein [Verrucomicrobiae bacterium]